MAYIRIVDEDEARDTVAEDYAFLSSSYSKLLGEGTPTPQLYRTHSMNGVSIQTSLDRLANALGVRPDPVPLLPPS